MSSHAATIEQVRAVKQQALAQFSKLAKVVGVGVTSFGTGYGLKINLAAQPTKNVTLPSEVGGVPVRVEVVGTIRKQSKK